MKIGKQRFDQMGWSAKKKSENISVNGVAGLNEKEKWKLKLSGTGGGESQRKKVIRQYQRQGGCCFRRKTERSTEAIGHGVGEPQRKGVIRNWRCRAWGWRAPAKKKLEKRVLVEMVDGSYERKRKKGIGIGCGGGVAEAMSAR